MSTAGYNEVFAASLRAALGHSPQDYPLKAAVEELTKNNEVARLFPGHDKLWLQKELSKWRGKLASESFRGTLQSLELYCTLTGQKPNDVLLGEKRYAGPARVEFLSFQTILDLAEEVRSRKILPPHGCVLPVLYAPERMTAVFLFLYTQKKSGESAVCMRFGISEPDGYVDTDGGDCLGGISTATDSSYYIADLSHPEGVNRLREAYEKIRREFDAVCGAAESPLSDAVDEFYTMMGSWARKEREDLLFSWYPPKKKAAAAGYVPDKLDHVLGGMRMMSGVRDNR